MALRTSGLTLEVRHNLSDHAQPVEVLVIGWVDRTVVDCAHGRFYDAVHFLEENTTTTTTTTINNN